MTITREHLELAALAAGIGRDEGGMYVSPTGGPINWRPHLDDGDAARLAARLNMMIDTTGAVVEAYGPERYTNKRIAHDGTEPDKLRAWREAVVLCAAAVGERMKGGAR